ncbi:TIGR00341 family protein [bacterium]|nr:TIGR00341 family protein [bacterium]
MVELIVGDADVPEARHLLATRARRVWQEMAPGGAEKFSAIVRGHEVEPLLGELSNAFGQSALFSVVVLNVEASLPACDEVAAAPPREVTLRAQTPLERFLSRDRISTDELYDDVADAIDLSWSFVATVVLSAVIAALGMRSGQTAVVIGAMVIAPFLKPNLALAMAATVGDWRLGLRSLRTLIAGGALAVVSTALLGRFVDVDPLASELHSRTLVHLADIALALASGAAGVLALSHGASAPLVGVMIAVALVPPLAATGLYAGVGNGELSLRALFLFANNLVCINIAGIAGFLLQGLPPRRWRITMLILAVWVMLLGVFVAMVASRTMFGIAWTGAPGSH